MFSRHQGKIRYWIRKSHRIYISISSKSHFHQTYLFDVIVDLYLISLLSFVIRMDFPLFEVVLKSLAFLIERPLSDFHFQVSMNFNHVIHNHVKSVRTDRAVSTKVGVLLTMSVKDKQIFLKLLYRVGVCASHASLSVDLIVKMFYKYSLFCRIILR